MKRFCIAVLLFAGAVCYSYAAVEDSTESPSRYIAQLVAAYELENTHWRFFSPEQSEYIGQMKNDFLPENPISSTVRFFGVPGVTRIRSGVKLSEVERKSFESIQNGAEDSWAEIDGRRWHYFAPIKVKQRCVVCHKFDGESLHRPPKEDTNPVIAYVSVELTKKQ